MIYDISYHHNIERVFGQYSYLACYCCQVVNPPVLLRRATGSAIWEGLQKSAIVEPLGRWRGSVPVVGVIAHAVQV